MRSSVIDEGNKYRLLDCLVDIKEQNRSEKIV